MSRKFALVVVLTLVVSGLVPVSTPVLAPPAGALPNPTTSDPVRSAPAGFLPAPNPSPYCDSPTYFDHWPAQNSGPWVTSDDPGNPNALTLTVDNTTNVSANTGNNAHWGLRFNLDSSADATLSQPMFYSQWVFTDFDIKDEGFDLTYTLNGSVPGGGVMAYGGDPAYSFSSSASNQITGVNVPGRNMQGYDLAGRFQVDFLGPVDAVDIVKTGGGVSGFVAGGGCVPLGVAKNVASAPTWDPATETFTMTYEVSATNNLPTEAELQANIDNAVANSAVSTPVPNPVPTLPIDDLQIVDDLAATFGAAVTGINVTSVTNPTGGLAVNPAFDGQTDINLLDTGNSLTPGQDEVFSSPCS